MLSICALTWDQLELTKKFLESIRNHTSVSYELIVVDNGSSDGTQEFIKGQADKYHFFPQNTGYAHGFNKAISLAAGEYIAICNNDTEFPANWLAPLIQDFESDPKCGLVFPCYTKGQRIAERWWPGKKVIKLPPFKDCPSGVVVFSKLGILKDKLGGFCEDYDTAGAEDLDLCFKAWAAGYNIYVDQRVLVKHKSKGTAGKNLPNWKELYTKNGKKFEEKWKDYIKK
ncbi:MAG: glycosyltransferase family 2 protein [Candidatus Saganbacteria bacterium]|nr:glycosyltransferase family 2 protein [Candidatus Saganbacteria bacterium]